MVVPAEPDPYPLKRIRVLVDDGVSPFEFAIPCEVFGIDRSELGLEFDFKICTPTSTPVRAVTGFSITAQHDLDSLRDADLLIVPALGLDYRPGAELVTALQAVVARGGRVMSLCSGAFVLGRAGLLQGRQATTHWSYVDRFAEEFPDVDVVPDVLFVEDGPILTSAGTAAGIDLCLHLVRQAFGGRAANGVARRMVVPPQREGGQAQFVTSPVREPADGSLAPVLDWVAANLREDVTVSAMARRAAMSERTFARRFRDETGTTPHHWVLVQRVAHAERLLEAGRHSIEEVAEQSGFGSATMLRHHFRRVRGTSPTQYRRTFSCTDEADVG